jgi:hypothetical protein
MELARARDRGNRVEVRLADSEYDVFSDILRGLTLERKQVRSSRVASTASTVV